MPMIFRVEQGDWLSNAYLIVDEPSGKGVLVDSNSVTDPLVEWAEREGTEITHVLLTHHHYDHVVGVEKLAERYDVPILAHSICAQEVDAVTGTIDDGDVLETGGLRIEAIHTPGHCADHLALKFGDSDCLTADVLFEGTVGGTGAPGATGLDDLRASIMDRLMSLPRRRSGRSGRRTRSSGCGVDSTNPPSSRVRSGPTTTTAARRRSFCGRPTTTAATRPLFDSKTEPRPSPVARRYERKTHEL
jgi:hydroxyacylglutathione hydrolase